MFLLNRRGQTSTEYVVLIGVVIVIAIVVANILGDFPSLGSGTSKKIDDLRLQTSDVAVESYASVDSGSLVKIKNNNFDDLTADAVVVNGQTCSDSRLPLTLKIGQSLVLNCS